MKNSLSLTIISMIFGLMGCQENTKKDFVFDEFKSQIESKGMKIDSVDETGLVYISKDELRLEISLENARRNYERDKDESHISDLVKTIVSFSIETPANWVDVKENVFISLFPNDHDFQDILHVKITDEFSKVYVYAKEDKLTCIGKSDLKKWNIAEVELDFQANANADNLLKATPITFETIENRKLGIIASDNTTLKPALLFAPTMKEKIMSDIGFPFYAVIPVRDFCYIFSENDFRFFSTRIGEVVTDEYKKSGYPITTEILKFTDQGVEAVGKYPVD